MTSTTIVHSHACVVCVRKVLYVSQAGQGVSGISMAVQNDVFLCQTFIYNVHKTLLLSGNAQNTGV